MSCDCEKIRTAWKQARFTMYGLCLDLRQAEMMQRVIDRMEAAVNPDTKPSPRDSMLESL